MKQLEVNTPSASYPIYFEDGYDVLAEAVKQVGIAGKKACIFTDNNVAPLYLKEVRNDLLQCFEEVYTCAVPPGESNKNLTTIQYFYDFLMQHQADRKTVIFGLGGGVIGDMAGFAAATFMRGLPFVQLPTSLLAQVDSSVGGKVGVDYKQAKNLVGAFYQPKLVYINSDVLKTLPQREFSAGMAEVIKYGMILSKAFLVYLEENKQEILSLKKESIQKLLLDCCTMKAEVVAQDERDTGMREILNFGHTIGHAIESLLGFSLLHGECVAIGMIAAMNLSRLDTSELKALLTSFGLPVSAQGLTAEEVYEQMFLDKKVKNGQLSFVLLEESGRTYRTKLTDKEAILGAIASVLA